MTMTTPSPATTPIATFEDILQAMEQDPRLQRDMRYHVLDEQYRELPGVVAQLATTVQNLTTVVQTTVERLDRLEAIVANSVERLDRLEAIVANSVERLDRLEAAVAELTATVAGIAERQGKLEAAMSELSAAVAGIAERQDRLEAAMAHLAATVAGIAERQDRLEAAMAHLAATVAGIAERQEILERRANSMHGEVGRLAGKDYESTINRGIATRMRTHLGLRRPSLVHDTGNTAISLALNSILDPPLDDDIITPDEALEILRADFVVAGARAGRTVYALGETSVKIRRDDITRAHERALLLAKATETTAFAFAVGPDEPAPEHLELARQLDVTIIIAPEPNRNSPAAD